MFEDQKSDLDLSLRTNNQTPILAPHMFTAKNSATSYV